jgi:hypothetical protein
MSLPPGLESTDGGIDIALIRVDQFASIPNACDQYR